MIKVLKDGFYELIETKRQTKILILDKKKSFAWITAEDIGEILVTTHKAHVAGSVIAVGKYRLYEVKDEPEFTDLVHLELFVGQGKWQSYLLPTGLPSDKNVRNRIIPTAECITKSTH